MLNYLVLVRLQFGLFEFLVLVFLLLHFNTHFPVNVTFSVMGVVRAVMGSEAKLLLEERIAIMSVIISCYAIRIWPERGT